MITAQSSPQYSPDQAISISLGNGVQVIGLGAGLALLLVQAQPGFVITPNLGFLMACLMIVFTSYAFVQYGMGRLLGLRFTHYAVGSSSQHTSGFGLIHFAAQPDVRTWAQTGPLARWLFAISGAAASSLLSVGMAALAANAGLWIGPVLVAANVIWLAFLAFQHRRG